MSPHAVATAVDFIRWFDDIGIEDIPLVGGKNASLGEMARELAPEGINLANGFAITAEAYRYFLQVTDLDETIRDLLAGLDTQDARSLQQRGRQIRHAILAAELPSELRAAIVEAYDRLGEGSADPPDVAVRSSATAEDLPDASFAGQQETYLNIQGHAALLETCKRCFASLFTDRAISYRNDKGFDHFQLALSIGVQQMVRSDLAAAGVMFSIDTESGLQSAVLINAAYGLGENVVQGSVNPDEYYVFKPTLNGGFRPILQKRVGSKEFKLIYDVGGGRMTKNVPVPPADRARFALDDDDILTLARWACLIERHYSAKRGRPRWAGESGHRTMPVQHHHAHVAAGMLEQGWLDREVMGVTWDGTGYGPDGTIWGGEFLLATDADFRRVARLRPFRLPGGEAAIREPWRVALVLLAEVVGPAEAMSFLTKRGWPASSLTTISQLSTRPTFSPRTSSIGRLFDAVATLALPYEATSGGTALYEGQLAMLLESACCWPMNGDEADDIDPYTLPVVGNEPAELDWRPLVAEVVANCRGGTPISQIARRFHAALALAVIAVARNYPEMPIVLSGGVFQNRVLTELIARRFAACPHCLGLPGAIPPGDGGLAAGQLVVALARLGS